MKGAKKMKDTLTVYMKGGKTFEFTSKEYTDYEYRGSIFVVYNNKQWVGVFNMSDVACVIYKG